MKNEYEIVSYSPQFKKSVLQLQTHLWGSDQAANAAYFEWKYERNPYSPTPAICLIVYAGEVVGMRGMFGAKWQIGSPPQSFIGLCGADSVIAPQHRNRGLLAKMMKAILADMAAKGHAYAFGMSTSAITLLSGLATGWRSIGSLERMKWKARSFGRVSPIGKMFRRRRARSPSKISHHAIFEQTPRPDTMAELVERIGNDGRLRHVRDREYFAWRFQNPRSQYCFLYSEDTGLEGYLIVQRPSFGNTSRASIVDWEAGSPHVRRALLEAAINCGNFPELSLWTATLSAETRALLQAYGFESVEPSKGAGLYSETVLVRPVDDRMLETEWSLADIRLLDMNNWDLRNIYADGH